MVREMSEDIKARLYKRMNVDPTTSNNLRSFLDPPKVKGHTLKGSNMVNYFTHSRNSATCNIELIPTLKRLFTRHLTMTKKKPEDYTYERVVIIKNRISINGRWWPTSTECEYVSLTLDRGPNDTMAVGKIEDFLVVDYKRIPRHHNSTTETKKEVFVRLEEYTPTPLLIDNFYQCPITPNSQSKIIHVDALTRYLTRVVAREIVRGEPNPLCQSTVNLIPVSNAYVQ
jgi:hypothetical protein